MDAHQQGRLIWSQNDPKVTSDWRATFRIPAHFQGCYFPRWRSKNPAISSKASLLSGAAGSPKY
jgi:hypothetical protein